MGEGFKRSEQGPKDQQSEKRARNARNLVNITGAAIVLGALNPDAAADAYRNIAHSPGERAARAATIEAQKEDAKREAIKHDLESARRRLEEATKDYEDKKKRAEEKGIR